MKRLLFVLLLWTTCWTVGNAQLPPGSIAPDFTVTDIDGQTHNLYSLLDQGKTVYLDFFATWCGPCWNYHNSHALANIWEEYGPDGTDEAFVIAIEGDGTTNLNCIYGPSGCNGTTQGDWTAGTPYPIADDASVRSAFSVAYYPTIYMVCPGTKKVYETGQLSATGLWNRRTQNCALAAEATVASIENVRCIGTNTGKITLSVSGGIGPYTYNWSNGMNTNTPTLNNVPGGTYSVTVTPAQGSSTTLEDILVEAPPSAITVQLVETLPPGCNGVAGAMLVEADGGWSNHEYLWNNGQNTPELNNVLAGTYTVSVTDQGGCVKSQSFVLSPAPPMTASIAPPPAITCAQATAQLNATASAGDFVTYNWFASNGGTIVSGGTSLTPTVGSAGTYVLQVTNSQTTCVIYANTSVSNNIVPPTASAGTGGSINCSQTTAVLQGSGSTGTNFTYAWSATNGGNILSGGNTLAPTVNAAGTYILQVTNTTNGCTATSSASVTGNNSSLPANATGGAISCTTNAVTLNVSGAPANATYTWTGPNNFSSAVQNPTVNDAGTYTVLVTDATGCSGTAVATVSNNVAAPGAIAMGGTVTCISTSVVLNGSSATPNVTYAWTGPDNFISTNAAPTVSAVGNYTLVVTNPANGCTSSATTAVLASNTPPTASIAAPANLNCNNVQLQLNATNSTQGPQMEYQWSTTEGNIASGGFSLTPTITEAGIYILYVTNGLNGCTSTASVAVQESAPVSSTATASAVTCYGTANGTASVTPAGGNGTYAYAWSTGANTATVSGLTAGQYAVVVTDGEGCTASTSVTVDQPSVLVPNATATSQTANGLNDGTAAAAPTGGTAGYTYLWNDGQTTAAIANLAPGNYTVVITDANGCTAVQIVTVNAFNCALSAQLSATNVACFGGNNGTATVTLAGANDPVSFTWSTGANTAAVNNLTAGTYTVAILDGNNCPAQLNVVITEPSELLANATATHETASGANDGTASAAPVGGSGNFTYLWSNNQTTATITGLAPGTYTVTVSDANNCQSVRSVTVNSFDCAISTTLSATNVTCFGAANGTATVSLLGGTAPFTYVWSNGANTATAANLSAGTYTVAIVDNNGCNTSATIAIAQPPALLPSVATVTNTLCPNEATGLIDVNIAGGTAPYTYLWNNGAPTEDLKDVLAGTYTVVVTDANNCTATAQATISSNDTQSPAIAANATTLALNANGTLAVSATDLNVQVSDNCGVVSYAIPPTNYTCDDLGTHELVLTATDASGNTATAIVTVTIVDNTAPVVTCPANIARCANDNSVEYPTPVAVDNCLNGGTWNLLAGLPSNSVFPVGATTTQVYSYTDKSGNIGQCAFDVTIYEAIVNQGNVVHATNNSANGAISVTTSGGTAPYTYQWNMGANVPNLFALMPGTYTVQVTDANGCVTTSVYTVENVVNVQEPAWMAGMTVQPNPTTGITRLVFAQMPEERIRINVLDISGRLMLSTVLEGKTQLDIDASAFSEGMYLIQLQTAHQSSVRKLVVQR